MMVRDGGGSMRVDLPTPWGKVDLAVRIEGGNIQVRMLADSPQVRDALNQDLPRLRESLAGQNLNLGSVEVGVGGGNAWAQNFGQSGFDAHKNFENLREFQTTTENRTSPIRRQVSRSIDRIGNAPRISRADGHIEVLV
jgi:flagellar hook-length control protein FliK